MLLVLIIKGGIRSIINWIKAKKFFCIYYLCIFAFLVYCMSGVGYYIVADYGKYVFIGICICQILKIIQKSQVLNVPVQLVQYKIFSQRHFKLFILMKALGASSIVLVVFTLIHYFTGESYISKELLLLL